MIQEPLLSPENIEKQAHKACTMLKESLAHIKDLNARKDSGETTDILSADQWIGEPLEEAIKAQAQLTTLNEQYPLREEHKHPESVKAAYTAHMVLAHTLVEFLKEVKSRF